MSFAWQITLHIGRIVFLRGSPERLYYTQRFFLGALVSAVVASVALQALQAFEVQDPWIFVLLGVFAQLTVFMLMMVILTARIARFRLARMMLALVLIHLFLSIALIAFHGLALALPGVQAVVEVITSGLYLLAVYAAGSVAAWGLGQSLMWGVGVILVYAGLSLGLAGAFQHLLSIVLS